VAKKIFNANFDLSKPRKDRGGEFIPYNPRTKYLRTWFHDNHIQGVCNSSTRAHLDSDLHRYFYAACFAAVKNRSPLLAEFPKELLPDHKSAKKAIESRSLFSDRFRVQVKSKPSTTIMSHISKDGHYYIHYDPTQCRSLTVREAARLQTFPDNYFFCGSRTQQYIQVGNAVPPYLAYQIAEIVYHVISNNKADISYGQNFRNQAQLEHVTD
jgi:DNA (cytosine-5)-methyltransferase 1